MSEVSAMSVFGKEPRVSLGTKLASARKQIGMSIEEAARATHIRVDRLQEIEQDNFTQFTHPSYARMFLTDYARHLGVPLGTIRHLLPETGECGTEGYQYLQDVPCDKMRVNVEASRPRKRLLPAIAIAGLFAVCGIAGVQVWITFKNLDRLGLYRIPAESRTALSIPDRANDRPLRNVSPAVPAVPRGNAPEAPAPDADLPIGHRAPSNDQASLSLAGEAGPG